MIRHIVIASQGENGKRTTRCAEYRKKVVGTTTRCTDTPDTDTPGTDTPGTDTPGTSDNTGGGGTGTITPGGGGDEG